MGLLIALIVVSLCAAATVMIAARRDSRVGRMSEEVAPPAAWPLDGDDHSATPYLRGATSAAALAGRR